MLILKGNVVVCLSNPNSLLLLIDGSGHNFFVFLFVKDTFFLLIFPIETCQDFLKVKPLSAS